MRPAIEVDQLSKSFPPAGTPWRDRHTPTIALDRVSLRVQEGEIYGLIGPNGAGKTTLLKILSTLLRPTSGTARVLGHDVVHEERNVRASVALVTNSERAFYYRLSGWENLRFFAGLYDIDRREVERRARPLARELGLSEAVLGRDYRTYSTGMQRKLAFLRASILEAPVLLLDEPTSSLDPGSSEEIRRAIATSCRERGQTVVLSANNLLDIERLADHVAIIARGRLEPIDPSDGGGSIGCVRLFVRGVPPEIDRALSEWRARAPGEGPERWEIEERGGGSFLRCYARDPQAIVPALVETLTRASIAVDMVDLRPVVLEEEFLRRVAPEEPVPEGAGLS